MSERPPARRPDDLGQLGDWLTPAIGHLSKLGKEYAAGALISAVAVFGALTLGGALFGAAVLFGGIFAGALGSDVFVALSVFVGVIVGMLALFVLVAPINLALDRGVLAVQRGEPFDVSVFQAALADTPGAVLITLVTSMAALVGSMFCIIPGWIAGGLFLFALPHYAHTRCSAMEALQESVALAKPRLWATVLYAFGCQMLVSAVASVPIVGVFLAMPVYAVLSMSAYLAVMGEPPLRQE